MSLRATSNKKVENFIGRGVVRPRPRFDVFNAVWRRRVTMLRKTALGTNDLAAIRQWNIRECGSVHV